MSSSLADLNPNLGRIEVLPPRESFAFLKGLAVTTDSVVAKAHLELDHDARRIFVDWGDLQTDTLDILPGVASSVAITGNSLPPGVYELFHAYDEPEDRRPFDRVVLVQIEDVNGQTEIRQVPITVTPKYRITLYQAFVRLFDKVDLWGSTGQIYISMLVDGDEIKRWYWEPSNNFFSEALYQVLEGSMLVREMAALDTPVSVRYRFREKDFGFDDVGSTGYTILPAYAVTETVVREALGAVRLKVDINVRLLRPLPSSVGVRATYSKMNP